MDMCFVAERNPGMSISRQWWEQPTLDIRGITVGHADAKGREETGLEYLEA